jgi:hypothetical protein
MKNFFSEVNVNERPITQNALITFRVHNLECMVSFDHHVNVGHSLTHWIEAQLIMSPGQSYFPVIARAIFQEPLDRSSIIYDDHRTILSWISLQFSCTSFCRSNVRSKKWQNVFAMTGRWLDAHLDDLVLHLIYLIDHCLTFFFFYYY